MREFDTKLRKKNRKIKFSPGREMLRAETKKFLDRGGVITYLPIGYAEDYLNNSISRYFIKRGGIYES